MSKKEKDILCKRQPRRVAMLLLLLAAQEGITISHLQMINILEYYKLAEFIAKKVVYSSRVCTRDQNPK